MKRVIWGLLAILATPVFAAADDQVQIPWGNKFFAPKDPPPVVVHDFGTVPFGTTLTHRFNLTNIYAVPMQIVKDPDVSCGCVKIVRYTAKLEPRESGFVDVEMDGRRFQGAKAVTIQVRFGPKFQSTAILQVRAFGRNDVQINPGQVNFGVVALGQQPAQNIDVTYTGAQINWQITEIDATNANSVNATMQRMPAVKGPAVVYRVAVTLKPDAETGILQEQIVLKTNDTASPILTLPVTGTVQSPLAVVQGDLVKLDATPVGQLSAKNLMIRGNKPFRIAKVEGEGEGLTVAFDAKNAYAIQRLTVTFKPTQAGELRRKLVITTDQKETTSVTIEATAEAAMP